MMRLVSLLLCLAATPSLAQTGFRWVAEPQFEAAGSAHRGVVPVQQGGLWGLMGADGGWIVAPSFQAVGGSGEGRFAVQAKGLWGVVDTVGQVVLPLEFEAVGTPAAVTPVKWQGAWYAVNADGTAQDAPLAFDTLVGNDGTCITGTAAGQPVLEERGSQPNLARPEGAEKISAPSGGYAVVQVAGRRGYVDCAYGSLLGGFGESGGDFYDDARRMSEGMAAVRLQDLWGFAALQFGQELPPLYLAAREFTEGLAPVQAEDGLWGYIDKRGRMVIPPAFDQAYSFSDGLAGVQAGDLRGFVTPDGTVAVPPQFEDFWRHDGGVVPVRQGGLWGVIAPAATDPATRFDLPLAELKAGLAARGARYDLVPSAPHWYFAQDIVSMHSINLTADRRLMVTVLNDTAGEVAIWDMQSHRLVRKIALPGVTQALLLPGTEMLAVGTDDGHLLLLDAVTGAELHRIRPHGHAVVDLVVAPDGTMLASADATEVRLWSLTTGEMLAQIATPAAKLRFSADSTEIYAGSVRGGLGRWSLSGELLAAVEEGPPLEYGGGPFDGAVTNMALGPGGLLANVRSDLVQQPDGFYAEINQIEITTESGRRAIEVAKGITTIQTLDISGDGRLLAYAGLRDEDFSAVVELRDLATGEVLFTQRIDRQDPGDGIARWMMAVDRLAFVPGEERLILVGAQGEAIVEFDPGTGRMTGAFGEPLVPGFPSVAPLDGTRFLVSDGNGKLWIWNLAEGVLEGTVDLGVSLGVEQGLILTADTLYLYDALEEGSGIAVDLATLAPRPLAPGEMERAMATVEDGPAPPDPEALARLPGGGLGAVVLAGGRIAVETESVGLHRAYDLSTGNLLLQFLATPDGEWLALTPEGFFAASANGARLVSVSSGLRAFSVDQVYQQLYRPDVVRDTLLAALNNTRFTPPDVPDLETILQTGPAPLARFNAPLDGTRATDDTVEIVAELRDEGGGIGRVEWRVNGLTVEVQSRSAAALGADEDATLARTRVALEPGANVIEIVAYNAAGLLASAPQSLTVQWDGVASSVPPALHVLAVGVNDYADGRLKLNFAAADARAFSEAMRTAAQGLFPDFTIVTLLDDEVTEARLDAAFTELGKTVKPQDVFLFFLAGHGKTLEGKYYFLPQDFRFEGDDPIRMHAIDQDRWQEWAARVKARKSVMIYDTCESGSLTGTRSVDAAMAQSAAVQRLTRAMGRTILSASTDDAPALEGYKGHGVMTYALLEGMGAGDANGNATIEVTELAAFIDAKVPELSAAAFGQRQVPQMSIRGSDFALGATVAVLSAEESFPAVLTHVVAGGTEVRAEAGEGEVVRVIDAGVFFGVYRIEEADGWARIAKDGRALGWVPATALAPLQ